MRTLQKSDDTLERNGGSEKNLRHSTVECPFSIQRLPKKQFRARVVKAKIVLHRKISDYGHTPDAYTNVLKSIKGLYENKNIKVLFGAGGN